MKRTPLKRSPIVRKTPLARTQPPKPKRKGSPRTSVEFSENTRRKARIRANFACEATNCRTPPIQHHHRRMRSQGGIGQLANDHLVCPEHHRQIHDNPDWAYRHGLLVKSHNEPVDVPVFAGCPLDCQEDHVSQ